MKALQNTWREATVLRGGAEVGYVGEWEGWVLGGSQSPHGGMQGVALAVPQGQAGGCGLLLSPV